MATGSARLATGTGRWEPENGPEPPGFMGGDARWPEPKSRRVETFEGGTLSFVFGPNRARDGYEIVTMNVNPPRAAGE